MQHITIVEPWGPQEIAVAAGRPINTVHIWRHNSTRMRQRGRWRVDAEPMPEPTAIVSGVPIWSAQVIRDWLARTDRLPTSSGRR